MDPETDFKVRRIIANVNETAQIAVNEPTMGLYRIQEHVHRTLPQLVKRKTELKENLQKINGLYHRSCYSRCSVRPRMHIGV